MGTELNRYTNQNAENRYKYNSKELTSDFDLNWSDYGARWYDASVGRFTSVDPLAEKYSFQSPYAYATNNPVLFRDILGMGVETIIVGEQEWKPGEKYNGEDEFGKQVFSTLETMNSTEAGSEVLNELVASDNNYVFLNESVGVDGAAAKFHPNDVGVLSMGGLIYAKDSESSLITISHELFHAYQYEKAGFLQASTSVEVGAYLFQDVVGLQAGGSGGHLSANYRGQQYDNAHDNLLYTGFNLLDYMKINLFFKDSGHNGSGIYDNIPINYNPILAPIKKFLPAFK